MQCILTLIAGKPFLIGDINAFCRSALSSSLRYSPSILSWKITDRKTVQRCRSFEQIAFLFHRDTLLYLRDSASEGRYIHTIFAFQASRSGRMCRSKQSESTLHVKRILACVFARFFLD